MVYDHSRHRGGLSLTEIVNRDSKDWQDTGDSSLSFADLQPTHMPLVREPTLEFEGQLLNLAGVVGQLATDYQSGQLDRNRAALAGRLVTVLRSLISTATEARTTLDAAAIKNRQKIVDR